MEFCSKEYAGTSAMLCAVFSDKNQLICLRLHVEIFSRLMSIGACDKFPLHAWLLQFLMEIEYSVLQINEGEWTFVMSGVKMSDQKMKFFVEK